jgi:hypothetical protein
MSGTTTLIKTEDHRKLLIDIFFAVIITIVFEKFLDHFFVPNIVKLDSFDIPTLLSTFSAPLILNMLFFFVVYFWVISHWIFYHELIKKYPYYRCGKFLVDVAIFSIMFVIISISILAYDNAILPLFIFLIIIWYLFACLWHLSDIGLRPLRRYLKSHAYILATSVPLLVLAYDPFTLDFSFEWYRYTITSSVIVAMIVWSVHRLKKYLDRGLREYNCDYVGGHPEWSCDQTKGGKLRMEIYKNTKKFKNNNDSLTFVLI